MRFVLDDAPKAVIAAVAVSLLERLNGGEYALLDPIGIQDAFLEEWWVLHSNGIVPQKPPKPR